MSNEPVINVDAIVQIISNMLIKLDTELNTLEKMGRADLSRIHSIVSEYDSWFSNLALYVRQEYRDREENIFNTGGKL